MQFNYVRIGSTDNSSKSKELNSIWKNIFLLCSLYVSIVAWAILILCFSVGRRGSVGWGENFLALSFSFPESDDTWSIEKKKNMVTELKQKRENFLFVTIFFKFTYHLNLWSEMWNFNDAIWSIAHQLFRLHV